MELGLLILLLCTANCLEVLRCNKYMCEEDFERSDSCSKKTVKGDEVIIKLRKCANDSLICDISGELEIEDLCKTSYSSPLYYPGEYCRDNQECYSNICTNHICVGSNDTCKENEDCSAGLYCKNDKCTDALKAGADGCDATNKCVANAICDSGKCLLIGSKENEGNATISGLCRSMYSYEGKCMNGPRIENENDLKACPASGSCTYKLDNEQNITEECSCGMKATEDKLCNPGRGNIKVNDVRYIFNYFL